MTTPFDPRTVGLRIRMLLPELTVSEVRIAEIVLRAEAGTEPPLKDYKNQPHVDLHQDVTSDDSARQIVQDDGDYGAVIVTGANLNIEAARLGDVCRALGGARVLVLQNEIPEAANIAAARAARDAGARVILNAAPARPMTPALLEAVDVLIVNRIEAAMLAGGEDVAAALPHLVAPGRAVIVTLGGEGLALQEPGAAPELIAPHKVKVVSTHGAGDCFVGTLAARFSHGETLQAAAQAANFAAARHVGALAFGADMT